MTTARKEKMLWGSSSTMKDMAAIATRRHNPFVRDGKADPDAYIEFVTQFNEFINHRPKPFRKMVDREMRL